MVSSAFPNASLYGQNHGLQQWTGEPGPEFYAQSISREIYDLMRIKGAQLLPAVRTEPVAMGTERHSFRRVHPGTAKVVRNRHAMQVTSQFKAALEAATTTTFDDLEAFDEVSEEVLPTS